MIKIYVKTVNGKESVFQHESGKKIVIQAEKGSQYQFIDDTALVKKKKLYTKKVGDDLEVFLNSNSTENPDIVIHNYFNYTDSGMNLFNENAALESQSGSIYLDSQPSDFFKDPLNIAESSGNLFSELTSLNAVIGSIIGVAGVAVATNQINSSSSSNSSSSVSKEIMSAVADSDTSSANGTDYKVTLSSVVGVGDVVKLVFQSSTQKYIIEHTITNNDILIDSNGKPYIMLHSADGYAVQTDPTDHSNHTLTDGTYTITSYLNGVQSGPVSNAFVYTGAVIDDFISNAYVFVDSNENGVYDIGEAYTKTDASGKFAFAVDPNGAPILAMGGVDNTSGLTNTAVYRAYGTAIADAIQNEFGVDVVLSPLSTLIASVAKASNSTVDTASLTAATQIVATQLGINLGGIVGNNVLDILSHNTIASINDGTATDLDKSLLSINRQLAVVMNSTAALIEGALATTTENVKATNVGVGGLVAVQALANTIINAASSQSTTTLNLSDASTVQTVLSNAMDVANSGVTFGSSTVSTSDLRASNSSDLTSLSNIIAGFNDQINTQTTSSTSTLTSAAATMKAVSDVLLPTLSNTGSQATSEQGGDISLASAIATLTTAGTDNTSVTNYINYQVNGVTSLETILANDVSGKVGLLSKLTLQLPTVSTDGSDSIDTLTLSSIPTGVSIIYVDPITKAQQVLNNGVDTTTCEVNPSFAGYLYIKSNIIVATDQVNVTATNTQASIITNYTGDFSIAFSSATTYSKPTITGTISSSTNDTTPTISGTLSSVLDTNQRIDVYDNGVKVGEATIGGSDNKTWSFTPSQLSAGSTHSYTIRLIQTDGTSNSANDTTLYATTPVSFTVDTSVDAPTVNQTNGKTISGTTEPGATVSITVGGTTKTVTADKDGNWTYNFTSPLTNGTNVSVSVTDKAGNISSSVTTNVVVDAVTTKATILSITDDIGSITGKLNSNSGAITDDTKPLISGKLSAALASNETLKIFDGTNDVTSQGTLVVNSDLTWTFQFNNALTEGSHNITTHVNNGGNSPTVSTPSLFAVDTTASTGGFGSRFNVEDNVNGTGGTTNITTSIATDGITNDSKPKITGTLTSPLGSGEVINVYDVIDGKETKIGIATVDTVNGTTWEFTPSVALADKTHTIKFAIADEAGNETVKVTGPTFTVDTYIKAPNTVFDLTDAGDTGVLSTDNITNNNKPGFTISVRSEAGLLDETDEKVVIVVKDPTTHEVLYTRETTYDPTTRTATPIDIIPDGTYDITYKFVDAAGNESPNSSTNIRTIIDTTTPAPSSFTLDAADDSGASDNDRITNHKENLTVSGVGEKGSTVELFDGETSLGTVVVREDGTWTKDIAFANDGTYHITAKETDVAGNVSEISSSFDITVDTTVPSLIDNGTSVTTNNASGDHAKSGDTISVTFEPNEELGVLPTVTIFGQSANVVKNTDGTYTASYTLNGSENISSDTGSSGAVPYSITYTDLAGNSSTTTATSSAITVDFTPPAKPSIDSISNDTGSSNTDGITKNNTSIVLNGSAEANSKVDVYLGTQKVGTATTDAGGKWTYEYKNTNQSALSDANYDFSIKAIDTAGNVSESSEVFNATIDTAINSIVGTLNSVRENTGSGQTVYSVNTTGTESGIIYSLEGTDAGSFTINATTGEVTINSNPDHEGQATYDFTVKATDVAGNITTKPITLAILDNNAIATIVADNVVINEGANGTTKTITYTVTRSSSYNDTSIDWILDSSNTVNSSDLIDNQVTSGTLSFLKNADGSASQSQTFTITVKGDSIIEGNEILAIKLQNSGSDLDISNTSGVASTTVQNDDIGFAISASSEDTVVTEGNTGDNTPIIFKVTRSATDSAATVQYKLLTRGDYTPDSTDFNNSPDSLGTNNGLPSGTVSFGTNETSKYVTLFVKGDTTFEPTETFSIALSNPSYGAIITGSVDGEIINDDTRYDITALDSSSIATTMAMSLEGNSSDNNIQYFKITRTGDITKASSINYVISGYGESSAIGNDLTSGFTTVTANFEADQSYIIIPIDIAGDSNLEGYETYQVALQAYSGNTAIGTGVALGLIKPDDCGIIITPADATVIEDSITTMTFTVTRVGYLGDTVTVNWGLSGSNVDAADFGGTLPSGTITFAPTETSKTITFTPSADITYEATELPVVTLTASQAGVVLLTSTASGMIINDEAGLQLSLASSAIMEGNSDSQSNINFTVNRVGALNKISTVSWKLIPDGTDVVSSDDFTTATNTQYGSSISGAILSGTLTFAKGITSQAVALPLSYDNIIEVNKGYKVVLFDPSDGTVLLDNSGNNGAAEQVGTIVNDDAQFAIVAHDPIFESNGAKTVTIEVTRTGDLTGSDNVHYAVSGSGTNQISTNDLSGNAFPSGTLVFAANETTKYVTVTIAGDSTLETDETFTVTLSSPSSGTTILSTAVSTEVTVLNDDDKFNIDSASQTVVALEGGTGDTATNMVFRVVRDGYNTKASTVNWSLSNNTTNGADFVDGQNLLNGTSLPSGTLTFASGETEAFITVAVKGDYSIEADESFTITLGGVQSGSSLGTQTTATGTITNDDTGLAIVATTTNLTEGDSDTKAHVFTVTRTGVLTGTTTVDWNLASSDINVNVDDFASGQNTLSNTTLPSGTVTFAQNETTKTITVLTNGDTTIENNESFTVNLSNANNHADITTASATGTIVADDIAIAISAADVSVVEGALGTTKTLKYTVTRSGDTASTVKIHWDATGMESDDFANSTAFTGDLTFTNGQTSKDVIFILNGDNTLEADQTLTLALTNPSDNPANARTYITTATAQTLVTNDDSAISIVADNAQHNEGNPDTNNADTATPVTFTIARTGNISAATTVQWKAVLSGTTSASDFATGQDVLSANNGLPSGTITFDANSTDSQKITVNLVGDNKVELDENFQIVLFNESSNTQVTTNSVTETIVNDDMGFSITALTPTQTEGNSGDKAYTFEIVRGGAITSAASVEWNIALSGNLTSGDFKSGQALSGTVSFNANEATQIITIYVAGDTAVESSEDFTVALSNAKLSDNTLQNIVIGNATSTIANDDQSFSIATSDSTIVEGNTGTKSVIFTVTRTGDLSAAATITYTLSGGAGIDSSDYSGSNLPTGTLSFAANETSKTVTVLINGDTVGESDETLTMTISGQSSGIISTSSAATTITNDDTSLALIAPQSIYEGSTGNTAVVFEVARSGNLVNANAVSWAISTTEAGIDSTDFKSGQAMSGTVTFAANSSASQFITIFVAGDTTLENNETLSVSLTNPTLGAVIADGTKNIQILTDDDSFAVTAATANLFEGNVDSNVVYHVTRTGSLTGSRTLTWTLTGVDSGDMAAGQALTNTITFADGQSSNDITVNIKGDSIEESDETMVLTLSNAPANTVIGTAAASTVIKNDDATLSIDPLLTPTAEGNGTSPGYTDFTFTVARSGYNSQTSTVNWSLDNTIANSVNSSDIYSALPSNGSGVTYTRDANGLPCGTVTFTSGDTTSKTITLRIATDGTLENNEALKVILSNPSTGSSINTSKTSVTDTIVNDDSEFNIATGYTASQTEGDATNSTAKAFVYTVTRTGSTVVAADVNWSIDFANSQANAYDFTNGTSQTLGTNGTVHFNAGDSASKTFTVYAYGDTGTAASIEGNENFTVKLSTTSDGASVGATSTATSTIIDDDQGLVISVNDYSQAEKTTAGGSISYVYTMTRYGYTADTTSSVDWAVSSQIDYTPNAAYNYVYDRVQQTAGYTTEYTADATDFVGGTLPTGTVNFSSSLSKTFTVNVAGDNTEEWDEWFSVKLSNTSEYDAIYAVYDNPTQSNNTSLFDTYYQYYYYWQQGTTTIKDNVQVAVSSGDSNYTSPFILSSIERDEAVFSISTAEVSSNSVQSLYNTTQYRLEGDSDNRDTSASNLGGTTYVTIGGTTYGYDAHVYAVQRTISTSGAADVTWAVSGYDISATANDFVTLTRDGNGNVTAVTANSSYPTGTVSFVDGQQWAYVTVYTLADNIGERDESYRIDLTSAPAGSSIGSQSVAVTTIQNDDTVFSIANYSSKLSTTEGGNIVFEIDRDGDKRGTDTVDWYINLPGTEATNEGNGTTSSWYKLDYSDIASIVATDGTSLAGNTIHYDSVNNKLYGTLTFTDGQTWNNITLTTVNDSIRETWREEFTLNITNPVNTTGETNNDGETPWILSGIDSQSAVVYENEFASLISVTADKTTVTEGTGTANSDSGQTIVYTITRTEQGSQSLNYPTDVEWRLWSNDSKIRSWGANVVKSITSSTGAVTYNYEYDSYGYVTFAAGETTQTVTVTLYKDAYVDQSLQQDINFAVLDAATSYGYHGDVGGIGYGSANIDTAHASVTTTLYDDDINLYAQYFGNGSIITAYEGSSATTFAIDRSGLLNTDVTVNYTITPTGSTSNADFSGSRTGTLTLAAVSGQTYGNHTYNISLANLIADDALLDGNETFNLTLSSPSDGNATHGVQFNYYAYNYTNQNSPSNTQTVSGTIIDNDTSYTVTPVSTSATELDPSSSSTNTFVFNFSRSLSGYTNGASVKWRVVAVDGTLDASDFLFYGSNLPSGQIYFYDGNNNASSNVTLYVSRDLAAEMNEKFKVEIYQDYLENSVSPTWRTLATPAQSAAVKIVNDDTNIDITQTAQTVAETNADTTTVVFAVSRTGDLTASSTIDWALTNISTTTATDFVGTTNGTITFAADSTSSTTADTSLPTQTQNITITLKGDYTPEQVESFKIHLSNASASVDSVLHTDSGIVTINNDDSDFSIATVGTGSVNEGSYQTFTITRTYTTAQDQTINWAVSGGTTNATSADDFTATEGSVTFTGNETSKTITVYTSQDTTVETDENYKVTISTSTGATGNNITTATANGIIKNEDMQFSIAADAVNDTRIEGSTGTTGTPYTFTVTRTGVSGNATVDWKISSADTNLIASDFVSTNALSQVNGLPSGTVSFTGTETSKVVTVYVKADSVVESTEAFTVTISNPVNSISGGGATINTDSANASILDDDSTLTLTASDAVKLEGDSGYTNFVFDISRTGYTSTNGTVHWAISSSDTNVNSTDFAAMSGDISLDTDSSTLLTIQVKGDTLPELNENFTVTLSNSSSGINIGTPSSADGTIQGDDMQYTITSISTPIQEGDTGTNANVVFTVTRTGVATSNQTINWSVAGTGSDPLSSDEFVATTGSVVFAPSEMSKEITVEVKGDTAGEANESFKITLTGPSTGATFAQNEATATIADDDTLFGIAAVGSVTKLEGQSGTVDYVYKITRSCNTKGTNNVNWTFAGSDVNAADFGGTLPSGATVSFGTNDTEKLVTVTVSSDLVVENDETFTIALVNPSNSAMIIPGQDSVASAILTDDVNWSISNTTIPASEGNANGTTPFVFTISRTGSLAATSVKYAAAGNGTNQADANDFINGLPEGTVTFTQGQVSKTITINVKADNILELDEGFKVTLTENDSSLTNTFANDGVTTVTIVNDDAQVNIVALSANNAEGTTANGTSAGTPFTFTVTREGVTTGNAVLNWQIVNGSTDNSDFISTSGTVTIPNGSSSAILTVYAKGDRVIESSEDFQVQLLESTGYSVSPTAGIASGTITNDDVDLAIALKTGGVTEGDTVGSVSNAGSTVFTITKTGDNTQATDVYWKVVPVSGTLNAADFASDQEIYSNNGLPSGKVTFDVNDTFSAKDITINLAGDGIYEGDENYQVVLYNQSSYADIITSTVNDTIIDDDDRLAISGVETVKNEGNTDAVTSFVFEVTRTGTGTGAASVNWSVAGSGTHALSADEFVTTNGVVNFANGVMSQLVTVNVNGDTVGEYDEGFTVTLSNPSYGSTITTATASGTVTNDDPVLKIGANTVSTNEGTLGAETSFVFTVTRTGNTTGDSTVKWQVSQTSDVNTINAADFGGFYPSGIVSFGDGESIKTVTVKAIGDDVGEFNETFAINLSDATNATILEGTATSTIVNDDKGIYISALDASKAEGNTGTTPFVFRIGRTGTLDANASVDWTMSGTSDYQASTDDFNGNTSGTVIFNANEAYRDITLYVKGDAIAGSNEAFNVTLSNNINIIASQAQATGTIQNDDSLIAATIAEAVHSEGDSGYTDYIFAVTRTGDLTSNAMVNYSIIGNGAHPATANDFKDGVLPSGTVTFTNGVDTQYITVKVAGDITAETDEMFALELSNPSNNATIDVNYTTANATITTDDQGIVVVANNSIQTEGKEGEIINYTYTIIRTGNISNALNVNYSIDGIGITSDDFTSPLQSSFTIDANINEYNFTLSVKGDNVAEDNESFNLNFFNSEAIASVNSSGMIKTDTLIVKTDTTLTNDMLKDIELLDIINGSNVSIPVLDHEMIIKGDTSHLNVDNGTLSSTGATKSIDGVLYDIYNTSNNNDQSSELLYIQQQIHIV